MAENFYVQSDGKFYLEVAHSGGIKTYEEADPGIEAFQELDDMNGKGTGKFIAIRSEEDRRRNESQESSDIFFQKRYADALLAQGSDTKVVRQNMKRRAALEQKLAQVALDRVMPSGKYDVEYVTDGEFERMHTAYRLAALEGRGKESDFQPVTSYHHKLVTKTGKVLRPLLSGEVGMRGHRIVCLQEGVSKENRSFGGIG